jgi:hypothetical protein
MSKDKTQDDYEVGYGKPPKDTRFEKNVSGNPKGRPKRCRNFDDELIRESESLMTINENGQRKRISKHEVVIKQLLKQAMTGSTQALRMYLDHRQRAHERGGLVPGSQPNHSGQRNDFKNLTDEELMWIAAGGREKKEQENGEGHVSNTE